MYSGKQTFKKYPRSPQANGHKALYQRQMARRSMKLARYVAPVPRSIGEFKFLDTAFSDGTLASTAVFQNLNVVPQGDTESQRVGRKITITRLNIRGSVTLLAATDVTNTSALFRMRIVLDKQTNGAQFAATDLLESDTINSFSNLSNKSRFRVLRDGVIALSRGGATATGAAYAFGEKIVPIDETLDMKVPIEFDNSATTGALTTQRSNSLCAVFQSSTGEILSVAITFRIRYLDG